MTNTMLSAGYTEMNTKKIDLISENLSTSRKTNTINNHVCGMEVFTVFKGIKFSRSQAYSP